MGKFFNVYDFIQDNRISSINNNVFNLEQSLKDACRVATVSDLNATYNNGAGTLTANVDGAIVIDSISLALDERVLVKSQVPNGEENGIYYVTTVGTVSTRWVLTRALDFNQSAEVKAGAMVGITEGATNQNHLYFLATNNPIVLGTTSLSFIDIGPGGGGGSLTIQRGWHTPGNISSGTSITLPNDEITGSPITYTPGTKSLFVNVNGLEEIKGDGYNEVSATQISFTDDIYTGDRVFYVVLS